MTNESNGGVSTRSLILLGAFAALALNRDLRRNLVLGTRDALDTAQSTLNETVKPALNTAAQQAQHAASAAAQQAGQTWDTLREEGPDRAHTFLDTAQGVVGTLAATAAERAVQLRKDAEAAAEHARKEYGPKLDDLQDNLRETADEQRQKAQKALQQVQKQGQAATSDFSDKAADLPDDLRENAGKQRQEAQKALKLAQKQGKDVLAEAASKATDKVSALGDKASDLRDSALNTLVDHRRDAQQAIAAARKDAEKELRAQRKNWNQKKLEQAIEKRIAPVHQQVQREFTRLEKQAGRKNITFAPLGATLQPAPKNSGMSGGVTGLLLLGVGTVVLARVPAARKGIFSVVDAISPGAGEQLHKFSHQAREILGNVWMEKIDDAAPPAAAAAKTTQGATTGASWGATVEPGSSASAKPTGVEASPVPTNPEPNVPTASSTTGSGVQKGAQDASQPTTPVTSDSFIKENKDTSPKN